MSIGPSRKRYLHFERRFFFVVVVGGGGVVVIVVVVGAIWTLCRYRAIVFFSS
jgi:hypothetical protein